MARSFRRWIVAALAIAVGLPVLLVLAYRVVPPPVTPLMLLRDAPIDRRWVALEDIAPALPRAVIAAEDNLFCRHGGVDWKSLSPAVDACVGCERAGGGERDRMQTAKTQLLWAGRQDGGQVGGFTLAP